MGDTVWIVSTSFNPQIVTATVEWISAQSEQKIGFAIDLYARAEDGTGWALADYNIGKTVFLTREAAEEALQKTLDTSHCV